jgi:hypothetical protein
MASTNSPPYSGRERKKNATLTFDWSNTGNFLYHPEDSTNWIQLGCTIKNKNARTIPLPNVKYATHECNKPDMMKHSAAELDLEK